MRFVLLFLFSALVTSMPLSLATAQTAQEKEVVHAVLAQLRAGEKIKVATSQRNMGSIEIVPANIDEARSMAQVCKLGEDAIVETITNTPGVSRIAVNLECGERKRYGLMLAFEGEKLTGVEFRPGGILFVPPPPPTAAPAISMEAAKLRVAKVDKFLSAAKTQNLVQLNSVVTELADFRRNDKSARLDLRALAFLKDCVRVGKYEVDPDGILMTMRCGDVAPELTEIYLEFRGDRISAVEAVSPSDASKKEGQ